MCSKTCRRGDNSNVNWTPSQLQTSRQPDEGQTSHTEQPAERKRTGKTPPHLPTNLCGHFVVRQTGGREEGDLLPTGDGVHDVDGGDTRLDHGLLKRKHNNTQPKTKSRLSRTNSSGGWLRGAAGAGHSSRDTVVPCLQESRSQEVKGCGKARTRPPFVYPRFLAGRHDR